MQSRINIPGAYLRILWKYLRSGIILSVLHEKRTADR